MSKEYDLMMTDETYAHLWITAIWEFLHEYEGVTQEDWDLYNIVREGLVHCSICDVPKARGHIAAIREHARIYREHFPEGHSLGGWLTPDGPVKTRPKKR